MNKLLVPLAYKYVAITVMLAEVNYCAKQLNLNVHPPVQRTDLQMAYVGRPLISGFCGTLETTNYSFSFYHSGKLRYITKIKAQRWGVSILQQNLELSQKTSLDPKGAYNLATQWLSAVSVDVRDLEARYHPTVRQRFFYPEAIGTESTLEQLKHKQPLPIFDVAWTNGTSAAVSVTVAGDSLEVLSIRQEDDSFSRRPENLIKDVNKLLAIPDQDFRNYSPEDRSNLVYSYSAVSYPASNATPNDYGKIGAQ